jgi:hypothetical protein
MIKEMFEEFINSTDKLRIFQNGTLLFSSREDMLKPLLGYLRENAEGHQNIMVFDKIMGNAAALLCVIAHCSEVYSPLGSEPAIKTLNQYGIKYRINKIVPYIVKPDGVTLCPMEKLSLDKSPQEFYQIVSAGTIKS